MVTCSYNSRPGRRPDARGVALIGRFQSWFFETGNAQMFRKSYVLFRRTKRPNRLFHAVYVTAILVGTVYIAALLLTGKLGILPVIAVVLQWLFLLVFYGTGFAKLEKELFAGSDSKELGDRFRPHEYVDVGDICPAAVRCFRHPGADAGTLTENRNVCERRKAYTQEHSLAWIIPIRRARICGVIRRRTSPS